MRLPAGGREARDADRQRRTAARGFSVLGNDATVVAVNWRKAGTRSDAERTADPRACGAGPWPGRSRLRYTAGQDGTLVVRRRLAGPAARAEPGTGPTTVLVARARKRSVCP